MESDWQQGGFGLYVHWPFCAAKCPYCDFNSHVVREIDHRAWLEAYIAELDRLAPPLSGRVLNSVFFGGGTPSLMDPDTVAGVLDHARRYWPFANDIEITLEANPTSVEADRFRAFSEAGINRVSMGVQSLRDPDLHKLGRLHSAAEARAAFDIARDVFDRVSFDLICARQNQSLDDWESELSEALAMAVDHLSIYQLTIEPGTAFGDRYKAGKLRGLPDDDIAADMYEATQALTEKFGLPAYEISNHARAGAESRHNLIYWRYGDYLGIGPGAHGRVTLEGQRMALAMQKNPTMWLRAAGTNGTETDRSALSGVEQSEELLMMGLRINEGVDLSRFQQLSGIELNSKAIEDLQEMKLITLADNRMAATAEGRPLLNAILGKLLAD